MMPRMHEDQNVERNFKVICFVYTKPILCRFLLVGRVVGCLLMFCTFLNNLPLLRTDEKRATDCNLLLNDEKCNRIKYRLSTGSTLWRMFSRSIMTKKGLKILYCASATVVKEAAHKWSEISNNFWDIVRSVFVGWSMSVRLRRKSKYRWCDFLHCVLLLFCGYISPLTCK